MTLRGRPDGVRRLMYFEVLDGDRRKARAESNDDPSQGGGARDLRFPREFQAVLHRMFPDTTSKRGRLLHTGQLEWKRPDGDSGKETIEVWPPTGSRPREIRIARIHALPVFADMPDDPEGTLYLFFIEDNSGSVRVHFADESVLQHANFNEAVASAVRGCAQDTSQGRRVMGFIDYDSGESYCHAR